MCRAPARAPYAGDLAYRWRRDSHRCKRQGPAPHLTEDLESLVARNQEALADICIQGVAGQQFHRQKQKCWRSFVAAEDFVDRTQVGMADLPGQ